jgi:hypothetical protein
MKEKGFKFAVMDSTVQIHRNQASISPQRYEINAINFVALKSTPYLIDPNGAIMCAHLLPDNASNKPPTTAPP